jgi:methionine biosynthesis protein MetW
MDAQKFENARWVGWDQPLLFRHRACIDMIGEGTVLDVGCGDGLLLSVLAKKGVMGEGVDFSEEAVRKCTEKGIRATRHSLDEKLPYADNSFDWVVALDVLEHQYDPQKLLAEMTRVSKKNVIVGVPNFSSFPARLQVLAGRVPENNRPNKGHIYWFNYRVLSELVRKSNLVLRTCAMNTFRPATLFGTALQNAVPNVFALSFVAHCTKQS